MNILVSGSSGMIGSALIPQLMSRGHAVTRLVRKESRQARDTVVWNPETGEFDADCLVDTDAVIHLAGESIAARRWSTIQMRRILESRVRGTGLIARAMAFAPKPPRIMISASAVGYYGDRGDEILSEDSTNGGGFLAEVCRQWEGAAVPASGDRTRLIVLRIGMVLSPSGGALSRMLPVFRLGAGGRIGNGRQYVSWIAIDDLVEAILFVLETDSLRGACNAVAPNPVTNAEFTRTLGRILNRSAALPVPALAIRTLFGRMGQELLLAGARVRPERLLASGFQFRFPDLDRALGHVIPR
jgi:uncharacterized protein (TIGR01777 family)